MFSLDQWFRPNIEYFKRRFVSTMNSELHVYSGEDIWAWFETQFITLQLEQHGFDGKLVELEKLRQAFNEQFKVRMPYTQFLENFNVLYKIEYAASYDLKAFLAKIKQALDWKVVLIANTNHYHIQYLMQQMQTTYRVLFDNISIINSDAYQQDAPILIATSMYLQTIGHKHILQQALPYLPVHETIHSFTKTITTLEGYPKLLSYHPGTNFQHFFEHIQIKAPQTFLDTKQTIVLSLGDFIEQDRSKTLVAFEQYIQCRDTDLEELRRTLETIMTAQESTDGFIYKLKMGLIDEKSFDEQMIDLIATETGVALTRAQFNRAWHAMNPSFDQVNERLLCVFREKNTLRSNQIEMVFVSDTNPKDMAHLANLFQTHNEAVVWEDGELVSIAGIQILTSYLHQKSKAELVSSLVTTPQWHYSPTKFRPTRPDNLKPIEVVYVALHGTSTKKKARDIAEISRFPSVAIAYWDESSLLLGLAQAAGMIRSEEAPKSSDASCALS